MAPLPPRDQRHPWLRFQVEGYTEDIMHNYEQRLETIFGRSVNWVHVLDFAGLTKGMRQTLAGRLGMVYIGDEGQELFTSHAWRRLFEIRASISGKGLAPKKVTGVDLFYLRSLDQGTANVPYLLLQYLFRHAEGRKSGTRLSRGHFIGRLAVHFGLVSDQGLMGLSVVTRELPMIDLHELTRLNIYERVGDTCAWVAPRPKRQPDAATGAPKDAPVVDEGAQADTAPVQAPQPPPDAPKTVPQRIVRLEEEAHEL
uniref:Uncharacterized protein n=1 Tax=Tanacetum cinerariifolium TaxID=118510 RepID=A0A699IE68_TANCI|nr:hypothetical protein [Tanacetum cinerariifolium]